MTAGNRRGVGFVAGGVMLLATLAAACSASGSDATTRLARHFDLSDVSSEESVESGLLAKLPAGTPESGVAAFLTRCRIGADPLSAQYPADDAGVIVCTIGYDPDTVGFVKESWTISFVLDERRLLRRIDAAKVLTGL